MQNEQIAEQKADTKQHLADIETHVKDGLITRKEADKKIREVMAR